MKCNNPGYPVFVFSVIILSFTALSACSSPKLPIEKDQDQTKKTQSQEVQETVPQ